MTMPKRDSRGHFIKASTPVAKASKKAAQVEEKIVVPASTVETPIVKETPAARSIMVVEIAIGANEPIEVKIPGSSATVSQALAEAQKILGVPTDGMDIIVGGKKVTRDTQIQNGAQIEAVKPAGQKAN